MPAHAPLAFVHPLSRHWLSTLCARHTPGLWGDERVRHGPSSKGLLVQSSRGGRGELWQWEGHRFGWSCRSMLHPMDVHGKVILDWLFGRIRRKEVRKGFRSELEGKMSQKERDGISKLFSMEGENCNNWAYEKDWRKPYDEILWCIWNIGGHISYLLLHNKLPQGMVALSNIYYLIVAWIRNEGVA